MRPNCITRIVAALVLLAALGSPAARAENYSDIWWNPNESGWGLTIADHGSQLFAVWFTYRQDGHPMWYVVPGGTLSSDRLHFQGDMYAATGPAYTSNPFDPSRVTISKVGTATIDFASAGAATFSYAVGNVTGSKSIQRQSFGNAAPNWGQDVSDIWWNPNESGWGITLAQHGNDVFGVWFTYDADGQPLWVVMPGVTFNGPDAFSGTLYTATGPYFAVEPFDSSRVTIAPQGSTSVTVNREGPLDLSCTGSQHATFAWTLHSASGSESICQQPFGDMPGTPAPDLMIADPLATPLDASTPGSFSAVSLSLLATQLPELNAIVPAVTDAERAMWTTLLAELVAATGGKQGATKDALGSLVATGMVGATTGMMLYGQLHAGTELPSAPHTTSTEGVTVTGGMSGGRYADGTTHAEFTFQATTSTANGPVTANSSADFQGFVCPAADGSVPFKLHVTLGASSGAGAKLAGAKIELLITGIALVNDSANVQQVNFDMRMQESMQRPDSHNAYVDASLSGAMQGEWVYQGTRSTTVTNPRINRMGSTTTVQDRDSMVGDMATISGVVMAGYLGFLQNNWQGGACIEVVATAPTTVAPSSTTRIDAKVHQKPDDVDLKVGIDAKLDGGASIQPTRIDPSPGTFVYVAPAQSGQTATINLKSKSRRGIGELALTIRTAAEGYVVDWSDGQGNHVFGTICGGLGSPFTLNFTSGSPISGTLQFTPSSASGGAVHLSAQGGGGVITYAGDGTYTVSDPPTIHMAIPQEQATYPGPTGPVTITVPGPSGDLPLNTTTQCGP